MKFTVFLTVNLEVQNKIGLLSSAFNATHEQAKVKKTGYRPGRQKALMIRNLKQDYKNFQSYAMLF